MVGVATAPISFGNAGVITGRYASIKVASSDGITWHTNAVADNSTSGIVWHPAETATTVLWDYENVTDFNACGYTTNSLTGTVRIYSGDGGTATTGGLRYTNDGTWTGSTVYLDPETFKPYYIPAPPPAEQLRRIIADRIAPNFIRNRQALNAPSDIREIRARQTLHRVLGDRKYRNFLVRGFVSVRGKSGLVYQIFPGHGITSVYKDGQMIERLCVVLTGDFPPTDSLIMRYLLILNNEEQFRSKANKSAGYNPSRDNQFIIQPKPKSLVDIFSMLKNPANMGLDMSGLGKVG